MKHFVPLLISSLLIIQGCTSQAQDISDDKRIPVKLVSVKQEEINIPIRLSGILAAKDELLLSFKTGGIIERVFINEGQSVKAGQILARLNMSEIAAYREQAETAYKKAQRDLQRIENLFNERVATLEQKQNATSALNVAKANWEIATFNEKHSQIIAPLKGKILKKFAEAGELVAAGKPVLSFGSTKEAFVLKAGVTDKEVISLKKGDPAEISFDAYPDETFKAHIIQISGTATPGSGTYQIELQLEKTNRILFSGFVGKAIIHPNNTRILSTFPINALNEADDQTGYVYTINDQNMAEKKAIKIVFILNDRVAFNNELGITQIINDGNAYLYEKSLVEVIK